MPLRRKSWMKRQGVRHPPKPRPMNPGKRFLRDPIAERKRRLWGERAHTLPCTFCAFREGQPDGRGGFRPGRVQGHHAIPLRVLKREGVPELAWYDPRLMIPLCSDPAPNRCHDRLELAIDGFTLTRAQVLAHCPRLMDYVREHDLGPVFEGLYPREP